MLPLIWNAPDFCFLLTLSLALCVSFYIRLFILSAFKSLGLWDACRSTANLQCWRYIIILCNGPSRKKPIANIYNWSCCVLFFLIHSFFSGLKAYIISVWREFFICSRNLCFPLSPSSPFMHVHFCSTLTLGRCLLLCCWRACVFMCLCVHSVCFFFGTAMCSSPDYNYDALFHLKTFIRAIIKHANAITWNEPF